MITEFAHVLEAGLSRGEMEILRRVAAEAAATYLPVYMVGGVPRDLVLGQPGGDFDLVIEGDAIKFARTLVTKYGGNLTVHARFGTAKWSLKDSSLWEDAAAESGNRFTFPGFLDLISARGEAYAHPGALPSVRTGTIDDDLRRRDFTINTLAVRLDQPHFGNLRDDFGALQDLEKGQIRTLHENSFADDPTRMYRAVRYEQRYGFLIAPETLRLIAPARGLVAALSPHRIRQELDLILEEDRAAPMLHRLVALNLLRPVHPAIPRDKTSIARLETRESLLETDVPSASRADLGWLLWLMHLSPRGIRSVTERLQFGRKLATSLIEAHKLYGKVRAMGSWKPSRCVAYLRPLPLLAVQAVYLGSTSGRSQRLLASYLSEWRHVRPATGGHDLKRRGLAAGPAYDYILGKLRGAWLDGLVRDKQEEDRLLDSLLARNQKSRLPPADRHRGRRSLA